MTKQTINIGTVANARNGDPLRTAFDKINQNFTELYTLTGGSVLALTEIAQDYSTPLFTHAGHTGISFTYDDANNKLIAVVASQLPSQSGNNGKYLTTNGSALSWATTPSTDRLINATDKIVLNEEGATRLSMYLNNVEKSRIQINTNDLLLSSLAGGVVLAATDGVGGEWRFKTNGNLESTGGNFLSTAETPAVFGSLNSTSTGASSGTVTLKSGTGAVDGGSIYIEAGTGGSGNDGEVAIRTGSGPYEWLFDNGGNLTFPNSTVQTTAWTGDQTVSTTSSVKFNTVRSNILAPLTTGATQYTIANIAPESPWTNPVITITGTIGPEWVNGSQLEITGVTTPTQANGTWYVQYRSANSFRLFNDAGLTSSPNASSWAAYTGSGIVKLPDSPANLTVVNNSNTWTFGANGILTVPGDINASGMVGEFGTVKTNYVSHVTGTTQIQIGDGNLANGKTIIITDQRVRITAAVPATSIGSTGDYVGSVAFNSTYIYYCAANYDGVTNIWKRLAWSVDTW